MIVVSPGEFMMGTPAGGYEAIEDTGEAPQVRITIAEGFAISRTEVTIAQFREFADATELDQTGDCRVWADGRWTTRAGVTWRQGSDEVPVACVSWHEAQGYVKWLSERTGHVYRLPSEAEWEYAARGGTTAPRWWGWNSFEGVSISQACDNANVYDIEAQAVLGFPWPNARCNDRHVFRSPAASFPPNPFGLHDVIGNVWEWTADCYTRGYWNRPTDGRAWIWQGGCEARVRRGGSWATRPLQSRATNRGHALADFRGSETGFRIVREILGD